MSTLNSTSPPPSSPSQLNTSFSGAPAKTVVTMSDETEKAYLDKMKTSGMSSSSSSFHSFSSPQHQQQQHQSKSDDSKHEESTIVASGGKEEDNKPVAAAAAASKSKSPPEWYSSEGDNEDEDIDDDNDDDDGEIVSSSKILKRIYTNISTLVSAAAEPPAESVQEEDNELVALLGTGSGVSGGFDQYTLHPFVYLHPVVKPPLAEYTSITDAIDTSAIDRPVSPNILGLSKSTNVFFNAVNASSSNNTIGPGSAAAAAVAAKTTTTIEAQTAATSRCLKEYCTSETARAAVARQESEMLRLAEESQHVIISQMLTKLNKKKTRSSALLKQRSDAVDVAADASSAAAADVQTSEVASTTTNTELDVVENQTNETNDYLADESVFATTSEIYVNSNSKQFMPIRQSTRQQKDDEESMLFDAAEQTIKGETVFFVDDEVEKKTK